jgi:aspartyl-tRNA(Asn)/glutamyl-tRNA(Gln) amidotransferase subunit A
LVGYVGKGVPLSSPAELGVIEAATMLRSRRLSAAELTDACLGRIEELGDAQPTFDGAPDAINAWVRLYADRAREQARTADSVLARDGAAAPLLCGIPIAVKDLYAVAGLPLTASSRVLEGNVVARDSAVWARLRSQGMVLVGHTHTHEFAAGGTTDQVGNPWDLRLVAGGSSGGSAAALAARMVPAALGSDTCGSLRIPSACCGTSAIKPTHGRIPADGIIPLAPTLDHPGPMARTVADCAALLSGMCAGPGEISPLAPPPRPLADLPLRARAGARPLDGVTVAVTDRTAAMEVDDEVGAGLERARGACEALGARVVSLAAPWTFEWDDLSWILMAEAWAYHRRFTEEHDRYRPAIGEFVEAARRFTAVPPYLGAQQRRAAGTAAWEQWFDAHGVDFVLEPTLPIVPYERGPGYDRGHAGGPGDPMIALTALWDMTGMPVACLPASPNVGASLIGRRGEEAAVTQAAIDVQEHALPAPVWGGF